MQAQSPFKKHCPQSSPFGNRIHPITKLPAFHKGIDFPLPLGTPLYAVMSGRVVTGEDDINGLYAQIFFTTPQNTKGFAHYAHLSSAMAVKTIKAGELIGHSGASGRVTGPVFHFQLELMLGKKNEYQVVNPEQYVRFA